MVTMEHIARAYREKKYQIKTNQRLGYTAAIGTPSTEFPIQDGGRNILGLDLRIQFPLTATAIEAHIANSVVSDFIRRLQVLDSQSKPVHSYINYGVAADASTKPHNRLAILFFDDAGALSDPALPDFAGAGSQTVTYRVKLPIGIPKGAGYKLFLDFNPVTVAYAADVTVGTINITVRPLTTDEEIFTWEAHSQVLANIGIGLNTLSEKLPSGKTLGGMLFQLVTMAEADVTNVQIEKAGAVFLNEDFDYIASVMDTQYVPARLTSEVLYFGNSLVWDAAGVFSITTNVAGTVRLVTLHPTGSVAGSPGAQAAVQGKVAPSAPAPSPPGTAVSESAAPSQVRLVSGGAPATFRQARQTIR